MNFKMPPNPDFQIVCNYLKSLDIHFCEKWGLETMNNLKLANPYFSINDIKKTVYEKWLSVNLRDLKVGSFPTNLSSYEKITLNGKYAVQVESMIDSARSCYSELQKIENPGKCENLTDKSDEDVKSKRCLTFLLCDGIQEIQAMEYQFIPTIRLNDSNFLPGFKMIVKGPVVCRKGMLLLQQENVKVYGGKVDTLCETNNLLKLLRAKLGINANNNESSIQQNTERDENNYQTSENVQLREIAEYPNNISDEIAEVDELFSQHDDILLNLTFESGFEDEYNQSNLNQDVQIEEHWSQVPKKPRVNSHDKVVMQNNKSQPLTNKSTSIYERQPSDAQAITSITNKNEKIERELLNYGSTANYNKSNELSSIYSSLTDDIIFDDDIFMASSSSKNINSEVPGKGTQMKISSNLTSFKNHNFSSVLSDMSSNYIKKQTPKTVMTYPFVYLEQIKSIKLTKPTKFTVKAIILTLKSKIIIKKEEYALKACISDGSSNIQVNFSSEVIEKILEYSPCEVTLMMSEKKTNSAIGEKLKEMFFSAQQKLLSINCLMEVEFFNECDIPLVVGLEEIQLEHVNALKARSC